LVGKPKSAPEEAEEINDDPKRAVVDFTFFRANPCSEQLDAASCLIDEEIAEAG